MIKTRIVVGVDGSAQGAAAVGWAATEAVRRGAELRILTAYYRRRSTPGSTPTHSAEEHAGAIVQRAVAQARAAAPGVEVKCQALPGYAVPVLLHAAEESALLVVGGRHEGGLPILPIASVSSQVATQARCSVVVVRGRYGPEAGAVVAGLDDGPSSSTVAGHAFEEASLHDTGVEAVTVGGAKAPDPLGADLDAQLDPWREKYPEVRASREYVDGRADKVLVQRSRSARLMVVGPRTHGFQGLMLGSIGSRLLQRSGCPVLIAR
ncbi:universal stress protein [Actinoplanes bogorensis]|uniref:Universal stress protein n=1 Tax=Paractinoplanes bogorensis TaxID=1610840 RepID=A0ABS5YNE5_9ACTN|nr:universal stress protein [Actinoplanes bogorensis]MBU2664940.1 universal stress protein [Actinoplanes bogorensis]